MAKGLKWSQVQKLTAAVDALNAWEDNATAVGVHVEQIELVLLDEENPGLPGSRVLFVWDEQAQEYSMRTPGD